MRTFAALGLTAFLTATAPLRAGTVLTIEDRDLPDGEPMVMTIQVDGKLVSMGSEEGRMIFRGDRQEMITIDAENKTYSILDDATLQGLATMMDAAMKQMEASIASLPPEQQQAARRMMGQQAPAAGGKAATPSETIERTAERATKEGYACVKYEVHDAGGEVRELWVTDWSNVPGKSDLAAAMRDVTSFLGKLLGQLSRFGDPTTDARTAIAQWREIDGLPIVTVELENGQPVSQSVLRSIEEAKIDAAVFEVPDGYTQQTLGGAMPVAPPAAPRRGQ